MISKRRLVVVKREQDEKRRNEICRRFRNVLLLITLLVLPQWWFLISREARTMMTTLRLVKSKDNETRLAIVEDDGNSNVVKNITGIARAPAQNESNPLTSETTAISSGTTPVAPTTKKVGFKDGKWNFEKLLPLNISTLTEQHEAVLRSLDEWNDSGGGATTCAWHWNASNLFEGGGGCPAILQPATRDITRWYFMGDSTMARPWEWCTVPLFVNRSTTPKVARSPQIKQYLGISSEESLPALKPINESNGEGPRNHNLFYKLACTTCQNRLVEFPKKSTPSGEDHHNNNTSAAYAEFLSMEYVRDVAFATKDVDTTQHVIARYMARQQQQQKQQEKAETTRTACVLSSGLHDIGIVNLTDTMYLKNFKAMYNTMKDHCDIWIQLEQAANGFRGVDVQNSRRFLLWNEGIRRILRPEDYQIQLFERSLNAQHGDNIHMDARTFYCPMANFFFSLMNVAAASDGNHSRRKILASAQF